MDLSKSQIDKSFKLNGLFLAPDASGYLLTIVKRVDESKRSKVLQRLVESILKQKLSDARVSKSACEQAVNDCKADRNVEHSVLYVINAFEIPRFQYSDSLKKFTALEKQGKYGMEDLFPNTPKYKALLYYNRFQVIHQRVLRNQVFSKSAAHSYAGPDGLHSTNYRIRPVEHLLASGTQSTMTVVLGMLCQLREGDWHLEDPTGIVRLDLSDATFHEGLFPEGCIVLIEGSYHDDLLHVTGMGLPPCETGDVSRRTFSTNNPFGGGPPGGLAAPIDPKMHRLVNTTQAGADAIVVMVGETRLDQTGCLDKLAVLFNGYTTCPPVAFVLTGNFLTPDSAGRGQPEKFAHLRQLLQQLLYMYKNAFLLDVDSSTTTQCPHLILVPGPDDPVCAPSNLLPLPGFPVSILDLDTGPRKPESDDSSPSWLHLASNPVRIRVYNREIVVFRAQYTELLLRHCIHLPQTAAESATGEDTQQNTELSTLSEPTKSKRYAEQLGISLARCLASQAHLLPLMGHIAPVYWAWDQALALHPLPDLVCTVEPQSLADINASTANATQTGNCRFINPGQFGCTIGADAPTGESSVRSEYAFKVFYPRTGVVENSCLPD